LYAGKSGSIILAMTACGKFSSLGEAYDAIIKEGKTFIPHADKAKRYEEKFAMYKKAYAMVAK